MKYSLLLFLFLVGCSGHESDKVNIDNVKSGNKLLVPPCLK
jgi:hypothetical protein